MTLSNVFPSAPSAFGNIDQTSLATWAILLLSDSFSSRPVKLSARSSSGDQNKNEFLILKASEKSRHSEAYTCMTNV